MNPPDYKFGWELDDGTALTIRTMRPGDAFIEQTFVRSLSMRSKTLRFFAPIKELSATALLRHLFSIASESGIKSIEGFILRENRAMLQLARKFGFGIQPDKEDPSIAYAYKDV